MVHFFDVTVAQEYGVHEAIMIANFQFWINHNKANGANFYDGHTWTYNSYQALAKLFPYFSPKQIRGIIDKLVSKTILIKANYNKMGMDKTTWYAFNDEQYWLYCQLQPMCPNGQMVSPGGQMDKPYRADAMAQTGAPIPDRLPDNKPTDNFSFPPNGEKEPLPKNGNKSGKKKAPPVPPAPPAQDGSYFEQKQGQGEEINGSGKDVSGESDNPAEGFKKAKTLKQEIIDIYFIWFKQNNDGQPPKYDGTQDKGLTAIITYLKQVVKAKMSPDSAKDLELKVQEAWSLVLDNWKLLEPFYQKRTKLTEINSDLQNILKQLKDGRIKKTGNGNAAATAKGVDDAITERLRAARAFKANGQ